MAHVSGNIAQVRIQSPMSSDKPFVKTPFNIEEGGWGLFLAFIKFHQPTRIQPEYSVTLSKRVKADHAMVGSRSRREA